MKKLLAALLAVVLVLPAAAGAKRSHSYSGKHYSRSHSLGYSPSKRHYTRKYSYGAPRDSRGRIKRSSAARSKFKRLNPCPSTGRSSGRCPGYVIDHVTPLKRGGADAPSNMQWQTREAARAKDRWE